MERTYISYTMLAFLGATIVTSGCLGVFTSDGPPSQFNVTFEEPTTGVVFSNLSYAGHTHNQLSYSIENISDEESLDRIQYYEKRDEEWEKLRERNYTVGYYSIGLNGPVSESTPPRSYQIQAWNETKGVLDTINVTIRNEGGGGWFS
ncbi:hypothetical protein [Halorhabdus amylolytica]|uniref:hypothetical protein n=1 Tax=Halorhabdus amylolytica TaxID=2559573 RepID=UPI0010AA59C3|nr:hypothetical protein [Halorhabdus amylolytica]